VSHAVAYLFPAFGMRYRSPVLPRPAGFDEEHDRLVTIASEVVSLEIATDRGNQPVLTGDSLSQSLQEHYFSYITSNALAAVAARSGVTCTHAAGYSMGLFAALTHCSALSYEDGLRLIEHVVRVAHEVAKDGDYGMGAAIGLTVEEVGALIDRGAFAVEITDVSADRVVVVAGQKSEVEKTLEMCLGEGCLSTKMLPVKLPFHSSWMGPAEVKIKAFLPRIRIRPPRCQLVSAASQSVLHNEAAVAGELSSNIVSPLNWRGTMQVLLEAGVKTLIECGFSERLCKLARGLGWSARTYHPKCFDRLAEGA
jgi:malonyl CoA-acyl carrier protein transacylase